MIDPSSIVVEPLFTKKILKYLTTGKPKPPTIDLYDRTKDPINHVQTFQSYLRYLRALDAIMCQAFLTTFRMAAKAWYATLKTNSIALFKEFSREFISLHK